MRKDTVGLLLSQVIEGKDINISNLLLEQEARNDSMKGSRDQVRSYD